MAPQSPDPDFQDQFESDEIRDFVTRNRITATAARVDTRPDVSSAELALWNKQDPDFPPEHYQCTLTFGDRQIELFQTVGADYPDEDDEDPNPDLYSDARALLLSPEFLLETAALKANSIDQSSDLASWISFGYCETTTPQDTYDGYKRLRNDLFDFLGADRYATVVRLAIEADLEDDDESEDDS